MAALWRACGAEFLGTAFMVAVGTGSVALGGSGVQVSLCFGAAVTLAILGLRSTSGAHINPAVSTAFVVTGHLPAPRLPAYILAQFGGGLVGSGAVYLLLGPEQLAPTMLASGLTLGEAAAIEIGITMALMASIYAVVALRDDSTPIVAFWVGGTVTVLAYAFGPLTGASMNPARTFGPNVLSGQGLLVFYTVMTTAGAVLAALGWNRWSRR